MRVLLIMRILKNANALKGQISSMKNVKNKKNNKFGSILEQE